MVALLATVIAIALIATTLVGGRVLGWWGTTGPPAAEPSPSPSPTQLVDPFAGTPAEEFPEGADGIVLPEAEPVGDFSAEEVAAALEQVREALIAARLDHTMLLDHNPEPFLSLLALDHRGGREKEFDAGSFSAYASQLNPNLAHPAVPRVKGDITYERATSGGVDTLRIESRFVWVYGFIDLETDPHVSLVVVHDELRWTFRDAAWLETSRGLWLTAERAATWGAECTVKKDGVLSPVGDEDGGSDPGPGGLFALKTPIEAIEGC